MSGDEDAEGTSRDTSHQQLVKNLIRLALANEHTRTPIRRADISAKVLGSQSRQFKSVFKSAQTALRSTFGMELVELPARERTTIKEKRAAQRSQTQTNTSANNSSKQWVLCSVLPPEFRTEEILGPAKVPTSDLESAYVGLYSFIVAVIVVAGGQIQRQKLDRILRRMNAEQNTPVDRTDEVLKKMEKQGYIVKVKEQQGGEETEDFIVGPRGRVEIGDRGVGGLVRMVYGMEYGSNEELERRLVRSLKVANIERDQGPSHTTVSGSNTIPSDGARKRGRLRKAQQPADDDDGDDD